MWEGGESAWNHLAGAPGMSCALISHSHKQDTGVSVQPYPRLFSSSPSNSMLLLHKHAAMVGTEPMATLTQAQGQWHPADRRKSSCGIAFVP